MVTPGGHYRFRPADVASLLSPDDGPATDAPVETIDVGPVVVEPAPAPAAEVEGIAAVTRTGAALAGVPVEALLQHEQACDSCWSLDDAAAHLAGDKEVA